MRAAPFLLVTLLLAGCSEPAEVADTLTQTDAPLAVATEWSPAWTVGQWWEWEAYTSDGVVDTLASIVISKESSGAVLATDTEAQARDAAAFDHPLLGTVGSGLELTGWGGQWDLFDLPVTDGKTWTATVPNIAWDIVEGNEVTLQMTARLDAALGNATAPGYAIEGRHGDQLVLDATVSPATGWFTTLQLHDIDPGQEGLEIAFRLKSSGLGYGKPYHVATATPLLQLMDGAGLTAPPPEGQPFLSPSPHATFTMQGGDGHHLYGYMVGAAVLGGRVVTLTDPDGTMRQLTVTGTPEGEDVLGVDEPAKAGEWRLATTGAGGFSGAFVELYEVVGATATLPATLPAA